MSNTESSIKYFNLSIGNIDKENAGLPYDWDKASAGLDANLTDALLENPSQYFMSVQRFSIPLLNIPLSISTIQTSQPDINKTIFSFNIVIDNIYSSGQQFIQHQPGYLPDTLPVSPVGPVQDFSSSYYYVYSINQLLRMWNECLVRCFNAVNLVAPVPKRLTNIPFFYYKNGLINLYAPKLDNYVNGSSSLTALGPKIYLNNSMYQYVSTMNYYNVTDNNLSGLDNYFIFDAYLNGADEQTIGAITYNTMTETSTGISYYSFLKSIVISTNMNIRSETYFNTNANIPISNLNYNSILTDFLPDVSRVGSEQVYYVYNAPSISTRLFEFQQTTPLKNISFQINITDKYDNMYPLYNYKNVIPATIKIGFFKKSLFNGNNILTK